jgi:hypothetical protein
MSPYDGSVYGKTLEATERAKNEKPVQRSWLGNTVHRIKCLLTGETP